MPSHPVKRVFVVSLEAHTDRKMSFLNFSGRILSADNITHVGTNNLPLLGSDDAFLRLLPNHEANRNPHQT